VWIYCRKSADILPEECGYIAGRVRLYCRKSEDILPEECLPEECGYIPEGCGYIAGRVRLYFCNENNGFPKLLSLTAGRTQHARTKIVGKTEGIPQ